MRTFSGLALIFLGMAISYRIMIEDWLLLSESRNKARLGAFLLIVSYFLIGTGAAIAFEAWI